MIEHDLDIDAYHAREHISHSKLRTFAAQGARAFHMFHVTRSCRPPVDTDALRFGRLFEDLIQKGSIDLSGYAAKPAGMNLGSVDGRAWKKEQMAAGREIIDSADLDAMEHMAVSVRESEIALELIRASREQVTLTCHYEGTISLQARPDWLCVDGSPLLGFRPLSLDLKTTSSLNKLASGRGVLDLGYHCQAAMVRHIMRENGMADSSHLLLACEKAAPFRVQTIEIPEEWLDAGWAWCEAQLVKLHRCYQKNEWPRVEAEITSLPRLPAWATANYESE